MYRTPISKSSTSCSLMLTELYDSNFPPLLVPSQAQSRKLYRYPDSFVMATANDNETSDIVTVDAQFTHVGLRRLGWQSTTAPTA